MGRGPAVALRALGRELTDAEAEFVVPACPDWTVREVFAHQAGVAADVLGGRLDGVATDPWTERQVAERADRSLTEILDEWEADTPRLVEAMAPFGDDIDPRMVIDLWTHDHDVRGAVGRSGVRDDAIAAWVADRLQADAGRRFEKAGLTPTAVVFADGRHRRRPGRGPLRVLPGPGRPAQPGPGTGLGLDRHRPRALHRPRPVLPAPGHGSRRARVTMSSTDLAPDPTTTDTSEPEVAHIAPAADVNRAYVTGEAITALCGVVFVPTRDPNRYPVCEPCKAVLDQIKAGRGGAN